MTDDVAVYGQRLQYRRDLPAYAARIGLEHDEPRRWWMRRREIVEVVVREMDDSAGEARRRVATPVVVVGWHHFAGIRGCRFGAIDPAARGGRIEGARRRLLLLVVDVVVVDFDFVVRIDSPPGLRSRRRHHLQPHLNEGKKNQ